MTRRHSSLHDRVGELTDEALGCRDLLHAWPRPNVAEHRRFIAFEPTRYVGGRVADVQRVMECTAGCGVTKVQNFQVTRDGRMLRDGQARYKYPEKGYLLSKPENGVRPDPVDRDELRYELLSRLYPNLQW